MFRSIQGEGKTQGKNSLFIRFPNCSLRCVNCDSKYARDGKEYENISTRKVYSEVKKVDNIVFTGGEPLLKSNFKNISKIIKKYPNHTYEIETNGTILLEYDSLFNKKAFIKNIYNNITFNISPKINFSQEKKVNTEPMLIEQVKTHKLNYIVKYLFETTKDLEIIKKEQKKYNLKSSHIYVQPIGINSTILKKKIKKYFDEILRNGWNISMRSHIFLFENIRNV
jgi:organic radical activating enzyme